jgi:hypothetical protein
VDVKATSHDAAGHGAVVNIAESDEAGPLGGLS